MSQNSIKTILSVDNKDVKVKLDQLKQYYKSTFDGWIDTTEKLSKKDKELANAKDLVAKATRQLTEEKAKGTQADKLSVQALNEYIKAKKDEVRALQAEKSALKAVATGQKEVMAVTKQAGEVARETSKIEIEAARRRNDIISSLNAQRIAEEKQRYATLSSLAAQKSKEIANIEARAKASGGLGIQPSISGTARPTSGVSQAGIIAEQQYADAIRETTRAITDGTSARDNQFNHMIRMMRWAGTLAAAFYGLKTAWDATIGTGLEAAAGFESMNIGIAALIAASSTNVTVMGKHITASQKFAMAQKEAADAVDLLRKANVDTPANLEQITKGFQAALGPALQLGFNIKQTVEYTRLMTIAAMSMKVPMEQLAQETRSILEGTIDQNSLVAKSLGLTNDQIKAHKTQGDLYEWLIKKLSDFSAAGEAVNKSWEGVTSDLTDKWRGFVADFVKSSGIFDGLKSTMIEMTKILGNQNGELDKIKSFINPVLGLATALTVMWVATKSAGIFERILNAAREQSVITTTAYNAGLMRTVTTTTTLTSAQTAMAFATRAVSTAMKAVPFIAITALVTSLATSFFDAKDANEELNNSLDTTTDKLSKLTKNQLAYRESSIALNVMEKGLELRQAKQKALSKGFFQTDLEYKEELANLDSLKQEYQNILDAGQQLRDFKATKPEATKTPADKLAPAPHVKTQAELDKEQKAREQAALKANREALKNWQIEKQQIETKIAMEEMAAAQKQVNETVDTNSLKAKYKLEFERLALNEKQRKEEVQAVKEQGLDAKTQAHEIEKINEAYYKANTEGLTWQIAKQKQLNDERLKGYHDAAEAAYKLFDRETAIAQRGVDNKDRGQEFTSAFGKNKIGVGEYQEAIKELMVSADTAGDSIREAFLEAGVSSDEAVAKLEENLAKLDNTFQSKVDFWKDKIAEIPDIELNLRVNGVDDVSNAFAAIANGMTDMNRKSEKLATYEEEVASRREQGLDVSKDQAKLDKLRTQNTYDTVDAYAQMAGVMSGTFEKGSKEAAAFQLVQQGLAMVNAVNAVAVASASSPWTGLATGAAMVAFLAPMLSNIGVVLGMGGTSTSSDAFSAMAANEGKGSVLGDTEAGSESISKSLELMSDLARPEFKLISQMNKSLLSIDQKMGGMASLLIRQGGFAMGEGYEGFDSGFKLSGGISKGANIYNSAQTATVDVLTLGLDKLLLGGAISGMLGGITSSALGGLFGKTSVSQTMKDSGITFADALLQNAIESFNGSAYQTIATTTSEKSWFSSSSSTSVSTYFAGLDDEVERQFSLVLGQLYNTTIMAGGALDTASSTIEKDLSDFVVSMGKISLKDKTGNEIQETLSAIFGEIADNIALDVFPLLTPFQKVGEALFETMTRVATGMEEAEYYINKLGKSYKDIKYTAIKDKQGDIGIEALRQSILGLEGTSSGVASIIQMLSGSAEELYTTYSSLDKLRFSLRAIGTNTKGLTSTMLYGAGGIDALEGATQSYIEGYLTEAQQLKYHTDIMKDAFSDLGLVMPKSKEQFTKLLKSINVTTDKGQDLYGRMILLADGYSELSSEQKSVYSGVMDLANAFKGLGDSITDTINTLLGVDAKGDSRAQISAFWDKKIQLDSLLAKDGDLTPTEQGKLKNLVGGINQVSLGLGGQSEGLTGSLVEALGNIRTELGIDEAILLSAIGASGASTEEIGIISALKGILPSYSVGTAYVPRDMTANIHQGEMVIDAQASSALRKYGIPNPNIMGVDTRPMLGAIHSKLDEIAGYMRRMDANIDGVVMGRAVRTIAS